MTAKKSPIVKVRYNPGNNDTHVVVPVKFLDLVPDSGYFMVSTDGKNLIYTPVSVCGVK